MGARRKDQAMTHSNYERNELDAYYTEPFVTEALLRHIPVFERRVWEPSAGRGDMSRVIQAAGATVFASDIDMSRFDISASDDMFDFDFLQMTAPPNCDLYSTYAIITNPPYDIQDKFVRHALTFLDHVEWVAMMLRSEFNSAKTRSDLFADNANFAFEIVLTSRPRWDWWFPAEERARRKAANEEHGPRHNYSWFVWYSHNCGAPSTQFWEGRES